MEIKEMGTEIRHFAEGLLKDDPYGYPWEQAVDAYLESGYKGEDSEYELTVLGVVYKVLKREEVTAFYDADGNTLFDVANGRLEKEYNRLAGKGAGTDLEDCNENVAEEENEDMAKKEADTEACEAQEAGQAEDGRKGNADAEAENAKPVRQAAKEKLEKEMEADKDKAFAEPVIGYLLKRCEDDLGLAQDVVQEHKTWKKCLDYIYGQARKQATENRAVVRNDVVYEWAEDYYHKDDKAEEEKKAREAAERKKKQEERAKKAKAEPQKTESPKPKEEPKPKKNSKDMDGQLDMFSMMGM